MSEDTDDRIGAPPLNHFEAAVLLAGAAAAIGTLTFVVVLVALVMLS